MSLQEERDHLVIGLALRRLCRRTVIAPRSASIPIPFLKSLFVFVCLVQPNVTTWTTLGTLFSLGNFIHLFAQTPPSHSIWLGIVVI
jgi:hypothetical protein